MTGQESVNKIIITRLELMRPNSQRSFSSGTSKPQFRQKLKSRVQGGSQISQAQTPNNSGISRALMNLKTSRHNHEQCEAKEEKFAKTSSKLHDINFSHHHEDTCVCESCNCGRHLCKMNIIKPDLNKNTIYQRSYNNKVPMPTLVTYAKDTKRLQGPHLDLNSTYTTGFPGKDGDKIERPHPTDLLHSSGPAPQLTSYTAGFPGYRCQNQYVKPTDQHLRGPYPFRSKSTYANEFVKKTPKKDDYTYIPDQLKTGANWYGNTTYGNFFGNPNPEYMAKPVKINEKLETNPNFNHQYQTIYKNDFLQTHPTVCPAKILLSTTTKGQFQNSKLNFNENTDFKPFSPDYKAISTSKHCFV